MSRPKGSKDKTKRKTKKILGGIDERNLIKDYESGISTKILIEKYNVSKTFISSMFKRRGLCRRVDQSVINSWESIDQNILNDLDKNISGVYAIYFINKYDNNDIKLYIGSSVNIKNRLRDHLYQLKCNKHYSKKLFELYNNLNYNLNLAIVERCSEDIILQKEQQYQSKWSKSCLLNMWNSVKEEDLRPWLQQAVKNDSYVKRFVINEQTSCKESLFIHKSGYARMSVTINGFSDEPGETKYLYKHRVAYWEKYGEYPELVRHLCNNPKCYNADHLEKGNHKDNMLDRRGDFPNEFEEKWLEFGGDMVLLSEYFRDKWSCNQDIGGKKVSYSIYEWEKKLDLRKKYPDIIRNNKNRRYNHMRLIDRFS
jgi:hypothetical protein